jgi:hypothetical protein
MAKKQTRRSISVSRATYDRLKAFCESSGISMSQFVENRVGDVLSHDAPAPRPNVAGVIAAHAASSVHSAPSHAVTLSTSSFGQGHSTQAHHPSPVAAAPAAPAVHAPHSSQASQAYQAPAAQAPSVSQPVVAVARPVAVEPSVARAPAPAPLTSAAARIAVEPPPPVIKPKSEQPAPKPAEKRPDQIFTF